MTTLFSFDGTGYQPATRSQILTAARSSMAHRLRRGTKLESPSATRDFLTLTLGDWDYETFCCLFLDNRHRVIDFVELFRGTIDGATVHPREVVREALQRNAAAVIFARPHPSGIAEPSQTDELITRRLKEALALIDIRVLDHLVIAGGDDYLVKPIAFAELLARIRALTRRTVFATQKLLAGSIDMDLVARTVTRRGQAIALVPQEFALLAYLLRNVDRVVTRSMLLENVRDIYFEPHTNVVESHISRLRARLNAGFEQDAIQTVRGVGYRLLAANQGHPIGNIPAGRAARAAVSDPHRHVDRYRTVDYRWSPGILTGMCQRRGYRHGHVRLPG